MPPILVPCWLVVVVLFILYGIQINFTKTFICYKEDVAHIQEDVERIQNNITHTYAMHRSLRSEQTTKVLPLASWRS